MSFKIKVRFHIDDIKVSSSISKERISELNVLFAPFLICIISHFTFDKHHALFLSYDVTSIYCGESGVTLHFQSMFVGFAHQVCADRPINLRSTNILGMIMTHVLMMVITHARKEPNFTILVQSGYIRRATVHLTKLYQYIIVVEYVKFISRTCHFIRFATEAIFNCFVYLISH